MAVSPQTTAFDVGLQENPVDERLLEMLRARQGRWVAVKGEELLVAALSPEDVVDWLARHDQRADSMFRIPEDELALSGLAPL